MVQPKAFSRYPGRRFAAGSFSSKIGAPCRALLQFIVCCMLFAVVPIVGILIRKFAVLLRRRHSIRLLFPGGLGKGIE